MQDNQETAGMFGPTYTFKTDSSLPEQFLAKLPHASDVIGIVQKMSELHEEIKRVMHTMGGGHPSELDLNRATNADDVRLAGILMVDYAFHEFQHLALMFLGNTNQPDKQAFFDSLPDEMKASLGDLCAGINTVVRSVIEISDMMRRASGE